MEKFIKYTSNKWLTDKIVEDLSTVEVEKDEFPNPITQSMRRIFTFKGELDGDDDDDVVKVSKTPFSANTLKPSQSAIFLGKSLSMAVGGVKGGDLGSIVSKDNHILDGHHRWAATLFAEPKAKIIGLQADMKIGDLVPVLRALGDAFGNTRRGEPKSGDINIYDATIEDALDAIRDGKYMNPKFYSKVKSEEWLEEIGGEVELKKRLKFIQSKRPPKGAPPRDEMPVIDADKKQDIKTANHLNKGHLDVRKPYYVKDKK